MLLIDYNTKNQRAWQLEWSLGIKIPTTIAAYDVTRIQAEGAEAEAIMFDFAVRDGNHKLIGMSIPWNNKARIQVWYGDIARTIFESLTTNELKDH